LYYTDTTPYIMPTGTCWLVYG